MSGEENKNKKGLLRLSKKTKRLALGAFACICAFFLMLGGSYAWAQTYEGRIAPNVTIGSVEVGGLDPEIARQKVNKLADEIITSGADVTVDSEIKNIPFSSIGTEDSDAGQDYITFDIDSAIEDAMRVDRDENPAVETFSLITSYVSPTVIELEFTIDNERFAAALREAFPGAENPAVNAEIDIKETDDGWEVGSTEAVAGIEFALEDFFKTLDGRVRTLDRTPITLELEHREAEIQPEDVMEFEEELVKILENAPYKLAYDPSRFVHKEWTLKTEEIISALSLEKNEAKLELKINPETEIFDTIADNIETPATDARITISGENRVTEFVPSKEGTALDREKTSEAILDYWSEEEPEGGSIQIVAQNTQPNIPTSDVNDLGITEILGVGTSDYSGSPGNRIKNIRNGVRLLNGILIPPGEELSLLGALSPFTYDNGYLPELVIKGDKIEPEVGGGLCQIGTTTFRATMNSGLEIVNRRNHSLVVSYYNDPSNGNPGTDATIYDPAPDYVFRNDTEHYVMFQAEMIESVQELRFTFWGTSDGRKGYYSAPVVERWIGTGPKQTIETPDLEPGQEKCQGAHVGADTSFTYYIDRPDGTTESTVFASHYRPLPVICLVGIDPDAEKEGEEGAEGDTDADSQEPDGNEIEISDGPLPDEPGAEPEPSSEPTTEQTESSE